MGVRRSLVLALVGVCVVPAAGGGVPAPPVIREPFTPLPCPAHPTATTEIEGCLERALLRSDRRIDARVAAIYQLLLDARDRVAFAAGERAWLTYRRRSCSAEASAYRGGSAAPLAYLRCQLSRNERHLTDLAAMERALLRR
jgi:uncharacterized protein YecT (DUF1311 family)